MTVAEQIPRIENLKRAVQKLTKQRDEHAERIKELRSKIEELEADDYCGCECGIFDECFVRQEAAKEQIAELAQIYTRMADNPRDARERLAFVLNEIDDCWRQFA